MRKNSAVYVETKYEKYHKQFIPSYYGTPFMVPRSSLKVHYGHEFFISHVVLTELYKMANTRFETETHTWGPSLVSRINDYSGLEPKPNRSFYGICDGSIIFDFACFYVLTNILADCENFQ